MNPTLNPNDTVIYPATGVSSRDMNAAVPVQQGGGNLNGSANTAHMAGHAGTGADQHSVPRQIKVGSGNYCGIV